MADAPVPSEEDLKLGEEAPEPDTPVEAPVAPEAEPEAPEADVPVTEEEAEPEPAPSPRESKRIQQILEKLKQAQAQPVTPPKTPSPTPDSRIIGEGEYDIDEINRLASEAGNKRYEEGLAQANSRAETLQNALTFQTRLELDAPKVAAKYEFLNQESDKFDPGVASLLNEQFLKFVGYNPQTGTVQNPNIRYDEFIEANVETANIIAAAKSVDSQASIVKQAAQTGVRPSGGTAKPYSGDDPAKMTDEQLDAVIAANLAALPKRR